jgi:hypothetical protein
MALLRRIGLPALACAIAAGCSGSPTAPSAVNLTDLVSTSPAPTPAPVSQTLTGTWYLDGRNFMTLTQNGQAVTGMPSPSTFEAGNGVTVAESGIISGTIAGEDVMLTVTDRLTINGIGPRLICTAGRTFTGVLSGNTLSGAMLAAAAPLSCGSGVDVPALALPTFTGPTIFRRQ